MKNRGITLIELMTVMIIMSFVLLVMTCQFVAQANFGTAISNQAAALTEVSLAMNNMTEFLRFADGSQTGAQAITTATLPYPSITAWMESSTPSHFSFIPDGTKIVFSRDAANHITFTIGAKSPTIIAYNITSFNPVYDSVNHYITLQVTATVQNRSSSMETMIRVPPY